VRVTWKRDLGTGVGATANGIGSRANLGHALTGRRPTKRALRRDAKLRRETEKLKAAS
jgi:hypothetical protein